MDVPALNIIAGLSKESFSKLEINKEKLDTSLYLLKLKVDDLSSMNGNGEGARKKIRRSLARIIGGRKWGG